MTMSDLFAIYTCYAPAKGKAYCRRFVRPSGTLSGK